MWRKMFPSSNEFCWAQLGSGLTQDCNQLHHYYNKDFTYLNLPLQRFKIIQHKSLLQEKQSFKIHKDIN